jgi:hypothetical protein
MLIYSLILYVFEALVDEGVSCISDSIEVLTTSEENDNDCLSEEADDQSSTKIDCFRFLLRLHDDSREILIYLLNVSLENY